jgi:hypothetical protein
LELSSSVEPDACQARFWCPGNLPEASDCDAPVAAACAGQPTNFSGIWTRNALIAKVFQCGLRANRRPLGDWPSCLTDQFNAAAPASADLLRERESSGLAHHAPGREARSRNRLQVIRSGLFRVCMRSCGRQIRAYPSQTRLHRLRKSNRESHRCQ